MKERITISQQNNCCEIIGAVCFATVLELRNRSFEFIRQYPVVTFDFSKVTYSDSSAVALLLNLTRYANQQSKKINFIHLPQQLLDIASLCGVLNFLNHRE